MKYVLQAACGCHTGKVRKNNEDNFYFDGKCLEQVNYGLKHPVSYECTLRHGVCLAVFDGMGGENFGEIASFSAARSMQQTEKRFADFFVPEKRYLERMTQQLNDAVRQEQVKMCTDKMGTTVVGFYFAGKYIYVFNVGDSRAYRLRNGEFLQLSLDHIEKRPGRDAKKAPLTQYLGVADEDMEIEPYIAKGEVCKDDVYLLCSDGLTDMLTNFEISDIMLNNQDAESCVDALIQAALEHGGRDNITAIVCRLM